MSNGSAKELIEEIGRKNQFFSCGTIPRVDDRPNHASDPSCAPGRCIDTDKEGIYKDSEYRIRERYEHEDKNRRQKKDKDKIKGRRKD